MNRMRSATPGQVATGAMGIVQRWLPDYVDRFTFEWIAAEDGLDVFEIESTGDKAILRGSTGVAQASALNWFLKYFCQCHISWDSVQLALPSLFPEVSGLRITTPYKYRYYFNYCTFSYSLPFWDWNRWEREIDWMALNGINVPLSITGQEAIWQSVYRQFGLSDEEIDEFLVGPAYLPFGWMGCIDGWGGPLPRQWSAKQVALQKKIVARQRELGMTPILQGFTGHVPATLARHFPDCKVHQLSSWAGFPPTYFLDPFHPLFEQIGTTFIEEQRAQFGTDHLYASDTFIEMTPASNDPSFLSALSQAIYKGMASGDPEAIWVLQGWPFYYGSRFWGDDQVRATLTAVPDDHMIVLDLYAEQHPYWQRTEAYHGKPWIWCMLHSFGGRPGLFGRMPNVTSDPPAALYSPQRGNLSGIGISAEAIEHNPVQYDLMCEMAWHRKPVEVKGWLAEYATRRYGKRLAAATEAWNLLGESVYARDLGSHGLPVPIICARPTLEPLSGWRKLNETLDHGPTLFEAWRLLLTCAEAVGGAGGYHRDLVDVAAHALTIVAEAIHTEIVALYQQGQRDEFGQMARVFLQIVSDLDDLLGTREEYLLGRWIASARQHGATPEEQAHLEWNARTLVTLWGGRDSRLHDYSCRYWSGLLSSFYHRRWELWVERVESTLATGQPFDDDAFEQVVTAFEEDWTHECSPLSVTAVGDSIDISRRLFHKYQPFSHGKEAPGGH
jgi:alpha-N-acetylglucosaminidase